MAQRSDKVRPNSRAGQIIKAMLDSCEVPRLPSLDTDSRTFDPPPPTNSKLLGSEFQDGGSLSRFLSPGMGVVEADWLIYAADVYWNMDARDHDAPEVRRYLALLGNWPHWLTRSIYSEAVVMRRPAEARGLWMEATDGAHDFPKECPMGWRLVDGTLAGDPPPDKPTPKGAAS